MATTATRRSTKSSNGSAHASQALKTLSRRASSEGKKLSKEIGRESAALSRRAGEFYAAAASATRRHPWIALGGVAAVAAMLGGAFWYRRR